VILQVGDHSTRAQQPAIGMLPPQQTFHPQDGAVEQIHLGLIEEPELVLLQAAANLGEPVFPGSIRLVAGDVEGLVAILADELGPVHGLIRHAQHRAGLTQHMAAVVHRADAGTHLDHILIEPDRLDDQLLQALHGRGTPVGARGIRQGQRKLVATQPGHMAGGSAEGLEPPAQRAQDCITGQSAHAGIDLVQPIHVDLIQADLGLGVADLRQVLIQVLFERGAVGQAREGIAEGQGFQLLLMALVFADVLHRPHRHGGPAIPPLAEFRHFPHPELALAVSGPMFDDVGRAIEGGLPGGGHRGPVVGVDVLQEAGYIHRRAGLHAKQPIGFR
jgi:hypothetical protein